MLVVCLHTYWSSRTQCPQFAEESLFQKLGCNLTILCLLIKKVLLPIFVLFHSCIWWIMNCLIILSWTCISLIINMYIQDIARIICLLQVNWRSPRSFGRDWKRRSQDWIIRHKLGMLIFLPILFYFLDKMIVCKCLPQRP